MSFAGCMKLFCKKKSSDWCMLTTRCYIATLQKWFNTEQEQNRPFGLSQHWYIPCSPFIRKTMKSGRAWEILRNPVLGCRISWDGYWGGCNLIRWIKFVSHRRLSTFLSALCRPRSSPSQNFWRRKKSLTLAAAGAHLSISSLVPSYLKRMIDGELFWWGKGEVQQGAVSVGSS